MFIFADAMARFVGLIVLVVLLIVALPFLIIKEKQRSDHQESVFYQVIPGSYTGQWAGNVKGIPDPTGADVPVRSGHISVYIPQGMSQFNDTLAHAIGPGSRCGEYWTISDIGSGSVTFDSTFATGSETYCGASDSVVVVKVKDRSQISVTWEDVSTNTVLGTAIMSRASISRRY